MLTDEVKALARQRDLRGVGLHCRRDYPANTFWPRVGFAPRGTKQGRGSDGIELTFLVVFDLQVRDLFSDLEDDGRLLAAIDKNVFQDLHDSDGTRNQEARFLTADWLTGQIELCFVDVLIIEIQTELALDSPREQWRRAALKYRELSYDSKEGERLYEQIKVLFGNNKPDRKDESDIRFVAKACASGADVLLTRDEGILEHAKEIEAIYGLQVSRPVDLILRLDEAEQASLYQPARFASTDLQVSRPRAESAEQIASAFHVPQSKEKIDQFCAKLRAALANAKGVTVSVTRGGEIPLFLTAYRESPGDYEVTLMRAAKGSLATTALRHAILILLSHRASEGGGVVRVTELC